MTQQQDHADRATHGNGGAKLNYPLLLLTVAAGGILAPLNSTMLAVALPELRQDLGVGHAEIAWLVSAYLIAMAVAQPLGGRLGDQLGRTRVFRVGLILFLGLSVGAALSPGYAVLLVCRTGQALVGAAVIPNGFAMLRESVPQDRLGRSGGIMGSAMSGAAAVGPLLGAALLALGSWRLIFLVNIPLVLAALVSLAALHYQSKPVTGRVSLDWPGAAALAVMLALLTLFLSSLNGEVEALIIVGLSVLFCASLAFFIRQQTRASHPVAEWRLFRIRSYAAATTFVLLSNLVMYTTILTVPFFVEEVQGKGSAQTGLLLAAISIPVSIISPLGGRLSDEVGRRGPVLAGSLLVLAGVVVLLVGISPGVSSFLLAASLLVMGVGLGLSTGPASAAAIESTPIELAGTAAGTNSMMRYVGSIIGAGVLGAVLNTEGDAPDTDLFRFILAVLVAGSILATLCSLLIHRFPRVRQTAATHVPVPPRAGLSAERDV